MPSLTWEASYFNGFLQQADRYTTLPRFPGARPDHVQVQSTRCCFPRASLSFVRPRASLSFDQWHVTRSPPIRKRIWVGRYNKTLNDWPLGKQWVLFPLWPVIKCLLMSRTIAMHVRYNSWYISLPSSAEQEREMTKLCVAWRTWTTAANCS